MAVISSIVAAASAIGGAIAAGAAAVGTAAWGAIGGLTGLLKIGIGIGINAINSVVSRSIQKAGARGTGSPMAQSPTYSFGPLQTQISNQLVRPRIYGKVKCAGNIIWQNVQGGSLIKRIVCFGDGEIKGFSNVKFNDIAVDELPGCSYTDYTGDGVQGVDTRVPGDTNEERAKVVGGLKYDAYLGITARASQKVSGNFNVTAEVEGAKIRVYSNTTTYTTEYSNNPAWCILDFLTGYNGCGIPFDEVDMQSFLDAADYCDEVINYNLSGTVDTTANKKTVTGTDTKFTTEVIVGDQITIGTETKTITEITDDTSLTVDSNFTITNSGASATAKQKRFTLNMILDVKQSRLDWLEALLVTCRGYITYQNGKISLKIEQQENTMQVFTPDNIITGSEKFWTAPREERYDIAKVQFVDPNNEYVKIYAQAEAPVFQNEQPIVQEVEAYGVTNFRQASRLAWFYLNQAITCNKYITFQTTQEGLDRTVGDVIAVTSTFLGYENKKMRIIHMAEAQEGQIEIICKEYNGDAANAKFTTNLAGSNNDLTFTSVAQTSNANKINITYTDPGSPSQSLSVTVTNDDINVSLATNGDSQVSTTASQVKTAIEANQDASALITVAYALGNDGSGLVLAMPKKYLSGGTEGLYSDQIGSIAPVYDVVTIDNVFETPEDVQTFIASQNMNLIQFNWQELSAQGVTYEIREGDNWDNSSIVATNLTGNYFAVNISSTGTYKYWIKAKGKYGDYSENAALSILVVASIMDTNVVISQDLLDEDLLSGTFTDCYSFNNKIYLDSNVDWDDVGDWENTGQYYENDGMWGESVVETGSYESPVYDIGSNLSSITSINYNFYKLDENASIQIEWKHSEDNVTWSEYQPFILGTYKFRYYRFKITMNSPLNKPCKLNKLVVSVDVPDRDLYFRDQAITEASSGVTIPFDPAYVIVPAIVANISDGTSGYCVISSKSTSQATIKAYNNAGTAITADIDVRVKGY